MPLFDLAPKDRPSSLFGRDAELAELVRLIDAGRWVVVLGPRMVGKTSLIKAANRKIRRPAIYVNLWGARGTGGFVQAFLHGLNSSGSLFTKLRGAIRRLDGLSVGTRGVSVSAPRRPLRTVWDLLDVIGQEAGRSVIEFDEIQEVAAASGSILRMLANVFNSHPGVEFVFTGSRFGVVRALLDPSDDSPLFGRPPATLHLTPFDPTTAVRFLQSGLRESKLRVDPGELERVVGRSLDGLPGWLTLFGNQLTVGRRSVEEAERSTVREGRKVVRSELAHFLEGRHAPTYWPALRILAGGASWGELRTGLTVRRGTPVNDNTVGTLLRTLTQAEIIKQDNGRYWIPDPMVRGFVTNTPRPPV
ncbi:MAG: ATP-binding protein [Thermoplasmata archaeon]|nr:ATP-binding protein [Thermoplasmata archaeon]